MTRLSKPADPVRPSAPDPVDAWLDVLVAMLSIPKADRQRVRDELEDHLRSRIDDLLIHGLTEPQALQKAVAELGETADLARQLSHAHKQPRSRRYAMHALLIALSGTVVALGVNTMRPNAALPSATMAVSAAVVEASAVAPVVDPSRITISVPAGGELTILDHLRRFADAAGLTLEIDRTALGSLANDWHEQTIVYGDAHRGPVTLADTLDHVMSRAEYDLWTVGGGAGRFVAVAIDGRLVVTTALGLDLRTTKRVVYPMARFAETAPDPLPSDLAEAVYEQVFAAVVEHVSPEHWRVLGGELANGTLIGSSLIVTAPARIHEQIGSMLDELHAQAVRQAEQREAAESARREAEAARHQALVERVRAEYERALGDHKGLRQQIDQLDVAIAQQFGQQSLAGSDDPAVHDAHSTEIARLGSESESLQMRIADVAARVDILRSRLIQLEYQPLLGR